MQADRSLITLSDLVRRAVAIVDPPGEDAAVEEFAVRYEDADQPVRGILDGLEERIMWGVDEDAPIVMAQAVTLYLDGKLDVDPFISHRITLDEVNKGFDLMHDQNGIRSVIEFA